MQSDPENEEVEAQQRPTSFFAFSVLREETKTVVASLVWESEKPVFGFALFHPGRSRAAGMWKSSRVGEIPKGRWKGWKSCLRFATLSAIPVFPIFHHPGIPTAPSHRRFQAFGSEDSSSP